MRVAFIYPATDFDQEYHAEALPMGLLYLTAVLERDQLAEIDLFDSRHGDALPSPSRLSEYDVIGFTAMSMQVTHALRLAQWIRDSGYRGKIVFGGPHASVASDHLRGQPALDAIFIGEAEETFPAYLRHLSDEEVTLGRTWIRDGSGEWVFHPGSCFVGDLDQLPFPAREKYRDLTARCRFINMTTTRGCPFQCNYCQPTKEILFGKRVRRRSVDNILAEIEDARRRFGIDSFSIDDDTFTFHRATVQEFCERIAPLGLRWSCQSRSDIDRETLVAMRDSGCEMIFVGVESGSQRVLDLMDKRNTVEKNAAFIITCNELGIRTWCNMMIGYPGETCEDMELSLDFVRRTRPTRVCVSQVTPFPGTRLWEWHRGDVIHSDWDDMARHVQRPKFRSMRRMQRLIRLYSGAMNRTMEGPFIADVVPTKGLWGAILRRFPSLLRFAIRRELAFSAELERALGDARSGDVASGIKRLQRLLRNHPDNPDVIAHLAWLHMGKGDHLTAADLYRRFIGTRPGDAGAHFYLGRALSQLGDHDQAREAFERALEIAPDHSEAKDALTQLQSAVGT
ncbi:radical SAM protein [Candidatus Sumerlaeota bacterium]|nr:radical SAM protein [Candidatus Sumerlaeota bacterium]